MKIEIHYRKVSRKNLPIAIYNLHGYTGRNGEPVITKAVVKADPRLRRKRNARIARAVFKHESDEASARKRGLSLSAAHKVAKSKEPVDRALG